MQSASGSSWLSQMSSMMLRSMRKYSWTTMLRSPAIDDHGVCGERSLASWGKARVASPI